MIDSFDAHLIIDAENHRAPAGVGERDDPLGDPLGIRQLNF